MLTGDIPTRVAPREARGGGLRRTENHDVKKKDHDFITPDWALEREDGYQRNVFVTGRLFFNEYSELFRIAQRIKNRLLRHTRDVSLLYYRCLDFGQFAGLFGLFLGRVVGLGIRCEKVAWGFLSSLVKAR